MREKFQKSCKSEQTMDYAAEASSMIEQIAGQRGWKDTRQRMLEHAARRLGFTYSRTFSLYYKRARVISAQEWDRMKNEIHSIKQTAERSQEVFNDLDNLLERDRFEGSGQDSRPPAGGHCKAS